jgi:hypothetical protein
LPAADQERLVASLALSAERTTAPAAPGARRRVGLFDVPTSMDHGWTRWVLERYAFEIVPVTGVDIEAGSLGDRVDVLLVTDEARGILAGGGRGGRRGGGGGAGGGAGGAPQANPGNDARIASIRAFVEGGGTLVCFNRSSGFAIDELDLPVSNAVQVVFRDDFAVNGSLLRVTTDPSQRVMAGMPGEAAIFYDRGPVFEIEPGANVNVLARYQDEGSPLLSGFLLGEQYLQGKAAAVEVPLGAGHVVLLGFRPQWRAQTFGTFRVIFNAAMR